MVWTLGLLTFKKLYEPLKERKKMKRHPLIRTVKDISRVETTLVDNNYPDQHFIVTCLPSFSPFFFQSYLAILLKKKKKERLVNDYI